MRSQSSQRPLGDADRVDRPGEAEVRLGLADEHGGAAIAGVAIDGRFGWAVVPLIRCLGAGCGEQPRPHYQYGSANDRPTIGFFSPGPPRLRMRSLISYSHQRMLGRVDKRDSQTRVVLIQDCFLRSSHGSRGFVGRGVGTDRAATAA